MHLKPRDTNWGESFLEGCRDTRRVCAARWHPPAHPHSTCFTPSSLLLNVSGEERSCNPGAVFHTGRPSKQDPGCLAALSKADCGPCTALRTPESPAGWVTRQQCHPLVKIKPHWRLWRLRLKCLLTSSDRLTEKIRRLQGMGQV